MSTTWIQKRISESNEVDFDVVEPELFGLPLFTEKVFVNIVTILGIARTGKSTLMNSVVGEKVFQTSAEIEGCTQGVWVSNTTKDIGEDGVTIYVDTEGQGNESETTDYKLLMPVLLLSKVIIFNIKGRIAATNVLDELALLVQIGERIKFESVQVTFGHLIITVRDYGLKGTSEKLKEHFFNDEVEKTDNIKKRNQMRQKIKLSFKNITVIPFPNNNDKDFENRVEDLKHAISEETEPHRFISLRPQNINECMKEIMDIAKKNECLDLDSKVESWQRNIIDKAFEDLKENFVKKCDETPMTATVLEDKFNTIKNDLIHTFDKETRTMYLKLDYLGEVKNKIKEFFQEKLTAMKREINWSWKEVIEGRLKLALGIVFGVGVAIVAVPAVIGGAVAVIGGAAAAGAAAGAAAVEVAAAAIPSGIAIVGTLLAGVVTFLRNFGRARDNARANNAPDGS